MVSLDTQSRFIDGPHGRLFVKSWQPVTISDRTPFLLFHDSLGCVDLWRDFPAALSAATGRPVIAYDRLGFGQSDAHPRHLSLDFIADEARTTVPILLQSLNIETFIACGHSVGGAMAVEAAAVFPTCTALITMGAQAFVDDTITKSVGDAKTAFADAGTRTRLARYHGDKTPWVIDAWTETWLDPAFASWSLDTALGHVRCPVLALHGEQDEYASVVHPARIAGSHGRVCILPGIGHIAHRDAEAVVVEHIRQLLTA